MRDPAFPYQSHLANTVPVRRNRTHSRQPTDRSHVHGVWLTRRAHLADAHSTSITPPPTQLHHWMLTLALLVFVGATTARPRHADEVGPSAKRPRKQRNRKRGHGKYFVTDAITEAIIEFPDTPAGYNDCRTMMRRVTHVLPPGPRAPSMIWPGHLGLCSPDQSAREALYACAVCGCRAWWPLCRIVVGDELLQRLHEAKQRAATMGRVNEATHGQTQALVCYSCGMDATPEADAETGEAELDRAAADDGIDDNGASDQDDDGDQDDIIQYFDPDVLDATADDFGYTDATTDDFGYTLYHDPGAATAADTYFDTAAWVTGVLATPLDTAQLDL